MLTKEQNERLSLVGPGTPCGTLMRLYWHPVAASSQLAEPGTRRVRLLGEDLGDARVVGDARLRDEQPGDHGEQPKQLGDLEGQGRGSAAVHADGPSGEAATTMARSMNARSADSDCVVPLRRLSTLTSWPASPVVSGELATTTASGPAGERLSMR